MIHDSEQIWVCHQIRDPNIHWRFVRANRLSYPEYKDGTISSTMVRAAMKSGGGDHEIADLETMALSPDLLLSRPSRPIRPLRAAKKSKKENEQPLSPNKAEL